MVKIALKNSAGPLDEREVPSFVEIGEFLAAILNGQEWLLEPGDVIEIVAVAN